MYRATSKSAKQNRLMFKGVHVHLKTVLNKNNVMRRAVNRPVQNMATRIRKHCPNIDLHINLCDFDRETIECANPPGITVYRVLGRHWVLCIDGEIHSEFKEDDQLFAWFRAMNLITTGGDRGKKVLD